MGERKARKIEEKKKGLVGCSSIESSRSFSRSLAPLALTEIPVCRCPDFHFWGQRSVDFRTPSHLRFRYPKYTHCIAHVELVQVQKPGNGYRVHQRRFKGGTSNPFLIHKLFKQIVIYVDFLSFFSNCLVLLSILCCILISSRSFATSYTCTVSTVRQP